jgi:protein associated with RNAse G/E
MDEPVHVDFRKWPDSRHWQFTMRRLGEDEHGLWLWSPAGMPMQRGHDEPKQSRFLNLKLITEREWWTAIWADRPDGVQLYVDIATPPTWDGAKVTMIDLDLDVFKPPGGGVEVHDEDEFEHHRIELGYPDHIVDRARTTTAAVVLDVEREAPPFGATAERWIERARTEDAAE